MARNIGSTPGARPGSTHAIGQRKAVSDGYDVAQSPSVVKIHQPKTMTGSVKVSGLTNRGN